MSIQMLPIAAIGTAISSNIWTEELPHGSAEDAGKADIGNKPFIETSTHHFLSEITCTSEVSYVHSSEQIPSNHSTDVVTPPPDFA